MKRKLAMLLAAVMTLSTVVSFNVFAASTNAIQNGRTSIADDTVMVEVIGNVSDADGNPLAQAGYLQVHWTTTGSGQTGQIFDLELSNAEWAFESNANLAPGDARDSNTLGNALTQAIAADAGRRNLFVGTPVLQSNVTTKVDAAGAHGFDYIAAGTTYATQGGIYVTNLGPQPTNGVVGSMKGVYIRGADPTGAWATSAIEYAMGIYDASPHRSRVVLGASAAARTGATNAIRVPLVIQVYDEEQPVTVKVINQGSGVTENTVTIVAGVSGGTSAAFEGSTPTGRTNVQLRPLVITETRPGVIRDSTATEQSTFRIVPPRGYEFDRDMMTGSTDVVARLEGFGAVAGTGTTLLTSGAERSHQLEWRINQGGGFTQTTVATGRIVIENIYVKPLTGTGFGEFGDGFRLIGSARSRIANASWTTTIGERVDWGLSLEQARTNDKVPELYAGRINNQLIASGTAFGIWSPGFDVRDREDVKLLRFTIKENIEGSWVTNRDTTLTLTPGARVIGFEITGSANTLFAAGNGQAGMTTADLTSPSRRAGNATTGIAYSENVITIQNIKQGVTAFTGAIGRRTASVTMDVYVSVERSLIGQDITATLAGGGQGNDVPDALVVGKVLDTVSVEVGPVAHITVGRANQPTADITIKEAFPGAFKRNRWVVVEMTEYMNRTDLIFSGGTIARTAGDGTVTNINQAGRGNASANTVGQVGGAGGNAFWLQIERESYNEPFEFTVTGAQLSAYPTLPMLVDEAYQVAVYGSAIAANFVETAVLDDRRAGATASEKKVNHGVYLDYARATDIDVTAGGVNFGQIKFALNVTAGWVEIDGVRSDIDASLGAPFNEGGTIYLPLRMVIQAFGIEPGWVASSGEAVIEISRTESVVFQSGSAIYRINNSPRVMTDALGNEVQSQMRGGRMYIPLRHLGVALGVPEANINWNDGVATFN